VTVNANAILIALAAVIAATVSQTFSYWTAKMIYSI